MPVPEAQIKLTAKTGAFARAVGSVRAMLLKLKARMQAVSTAAKFMLVGQIVVIAKLIKASATQEEAERRLSAALKLSGAEAKAWTEHLKRVAAEMQNVSTHGDEATLAVMQFGLSLGIGADKIEEATKGAAGLADMLGIDVNAAMKMVAMAYAGNTSMLKRYIPELEGVTDAAEAQAIVMKKMAEGWRFSQDIAKTSAGTLKSFGNIVGDVAEVLGKALMPSLTALVEWLKPLVLGFQEWAKEHQALIGTIVTFGVALTAAVAFMGPLLAMAGMVATGLSAVGAAFAAIASVAAGAFGAASAAVTALATPIGAVVAGFALLAGAVAYFSIAGDTMKEKWESISEWFAGIGEWIGKVWDGLVEKAVYFSIFASAAMEDWSKVLRGVMLTVALNMISSFLDIGHWLTEVMPAYLGWFFRNWKGVWEDVVEFLATVLANMGANIKNFFSNIWAWLKGDDVNWEWTALTDGFERTVKEEFPEIAKRELGQVEQWLTDEIDKSLGSIYDKADKRFAEWKKKRDLEGLGPVLGPELPPVAPPPPPPKPEPEPEPEEEKKAAVAIASASAAFEDLTSAYGRIASAAGGRSPAFEQIDLAKEGNKKLDGIVIMVDAIGERISEAIKAQSTVGTYGG